MADDELQIGPRARLRAADLSERDLSGVNLSEADLYGADLLGADLSSATLSSASLSWARLGGADLSYADLRIAGLSMADLARAKLCHADLTEADLSWSRLLSADLSGADLSRVNLEGANLRDVRLSGANLSEATIRNADLSGADLSRANLSGANLVGASLSDADLYDANLQGAVASGTGWNALDLSVARSLSDIRHLGPSTIGIDTLYRSEGRIPADFLRGCGLPDYFVGLVPGLTVTAPIQHYSAFISYSYVDKPLARAIYDYLFHRKKVPIWLDEHEIEAGALVMKSIDQAIRRMDKVVLLCSEASLNSWWVREEIERWTDRERELSHKAGEAVSMVIPVDLDGYLWSSGNEYASTITKAKVLDAKGWTNDVDLRAKVSDQLHRALRLDRRTPLQILQNQAANLSSGESG